MAVSAAKEWELRKAIYDQDGQFLRYRDGLKWSRFQTASAIEGAALYVAFQVPALSPAEKLGMMAFATVLTALTFLLVVIDERDVAAHLQRIKAFEADAGYPYPEVNRRPMLGARTTRYVMALLIAFNLVVIAKLAVPLVCP